MVTSMAQTHSKSITTQLSGISNRHVLLKFTWQDRSTNPPARKHTEVPKPIQYDLFHCSELAGAYTEEIVPSALRMYNSGDTSEIVFVHGNGTLSLLWHGESYLNRGTEFECLDRIGR